MWQGGHQWKRIYKLEHDDAVLAVYAIAHTTPSGYRHIYAITGSYDGTAGVWNLHSGAHLRTLQHDNTVLAVHAMGDHVITGSCDNTAGVWDLRSGNRLWTLQHNN